MGAFDHCQAGINLGGWISQYGEFRKENFDRGIKEEDIARIASWGMDHIRLPFDYPVLLDDSDLYTFKEWGFAYIDNCIRWCQKYGLAIILDLHYTPGYRFQDAGHNKLLHDAEYQKVFINIWQTIAKRYASEGPDVLFELLNEVVEQPSDPWNALCARTVEAIHAVTPKRVVILGGVQWNSIFELKNIAVLPDPYVEYTFHFYETNLFTHQFAWWADGCADYATEVKYPGGTFPGLAEFLDKNPQVNYLFKRMIGKTYDKKQVHEDLQPALDFIKTSGGHIPYCGEFGVFFAADAASRVNWLRDVITFFTEHHIGHALWSYRGEGFGLVDIRGRAYNEEMIKIASMK
jgi:hypothetical protein